MRSNPVGKNNLKCIIVNCRSIPGKKAEFLNMIDASNPDIVIWTESWLTPDILNNEIFPKNYNVYRKDRVLGNKKCGGGVFLMVRSNFVSIELTELDTNCEIIWAQIQLKGNKFLNVGSFYRPDHTDGKYMEELRSSLSRICSNSQHTWLGGDFNLPDIIWDTESVRPSGRQPKISQQTLDISNDHGQPKSKSTSQEGQTTLTSYLPTTPALSTGQVSSLASRITTSPY